MTFLPLLKWCDLIRAVVIVALLLVTSQGSSAQPKIEQGTANVNGAAIFYETKGKGFPIVFVSGGGILDRRGWDAQFDTFAKHYRVVRYDVRGIGKSSRPEKPFSHSADLYALLTFLKIKRAHIVGLSVGGAIAIDFAIEHPEIVDSLILGAPGLSSDAKAQENMQGLNALTNLVKTNGIEQVIQLTLDAPFVLSKENTAARKKVREIYSDNRDVFASGFPVYSLWQPIQPPPEMRLASIRARVLIIRGDNDNPAYAALTDKISKGIPKSATVMIPGGTHFLNLEKPAEFNDAMQVFLRHNSPLSNFECPKGTTYRKKRIVAKTAGDPFIPQFAQFEEYCQRRGENGSFIKDGPYLVWGPNGEQYLRGQYLDGRKEGNWTRWIPSQILEDTWRKGEFVQSKVLSEPHSYVIDFAACVPHEYGIPTAFGSTSYRLTGKRRNFCELRYSKFIEMGQDPEITCLVPLTKKKLTFQNAPLGLDFSIIKSYCKQPVQSR